MVFAISDRLLHNYLLPRDCPRVTYYANANTSRQDHLRFLGGSAATHVVAIEAAWFHRIDTTVLYAYELPPETFTILDETAGYYISDQPIVPATIRRIDHIFDELLSRDHLELRILPELWTLGNAVTASSLSYSLIRMRNASAL